MKCRSCDGDACETILDLGHAPVANALRAPGSSKGPKYPLAIMLCTSCTLVQLVETLPPAALFGDYRYASSTSPSMVAHVRALAQFLTVDEGLQPQSLVVEVGSNDGYLLQHYLGVARVLGVEPAERLGRAAEERGIPTEFSYFSHAVAKEIRKAHGAASVLHAHNVFAHIPSLRDAAQGIKELLAPDGVAVLEVPYLVDMVITGAFDTIYHEHVFYFSLRALQRLFDHVEMKVTDVHHVDLHGGSLQVHVRHAGAAAAPSPRVAACLAGEARLHDPSFYEPLRLQKNALAERLPDLLDLLRQNRLLVAAYGASAKGTTLLHAAGVTERLLDFVVDKNPLKHGLWLPDLNLPVFPPSELLKQQPSHTLLLTWNFRDEILTEQAAYRAAGGKFIVPVPRLETVQ